MTGKKETENILETVVDVYRHDNRGERNRKYNQLLDDISSKGKYSSAKTILNLYSLGVRYMENGRSCDENLFNALSNLSCIITLRTPKLGERCGEKMNYVWNRNWHLLTAPTG